METVPALALAVSEADWNENRLLGYVRLTVAEIPAGTVMDMVTVSPILTEDALAPTDRLSALASMSGTIRHPNNRNSESIKQIARLFPLVFPYFTLCILFISIPSYARFARFYSKRI